MAVPDHHKQNLETIYRAAENGDLAIVECTDKITGKIVHVLCCVRHADDRQYEVTPIAKMFEGDPYAELNPP